MVNTKFRGNRPAGSGEEDLSGFYHIRAWRPSWSCNMDFAIKLKMPLQRRLQIKFQLTGQVVSEKKIFEIVDDDDDGRRIMAIL